MIRRTWYRNRRTGTFMCYLGMYNDCHKPHFLTTAGQDDAMRQTTDELNRILDDLSGRDPGLAILGVGEFVMLAHVERGDGEGPGESDVTVESEKEVIWDALAIGREQS